MPSSLLLLVGEESRIWLYSKRDGRSEERSVSFGIDESDYLLRLEVLLFEWDVLAVLVVLLRAVVELVVLVGLSPRGLVVER
jgi:hypothetical protein